MKTHTLLAIASSTFLMMGASQAAVTVGGFAFWNGTSSPLSNNFDASSYDMLVVIVTGEHGNGQNNITGDSNGVTYDGVAMTEIIDRNPRASPIDENFNSMYVLSKPTTSTGLIQASVTNRGNVTVFGLNADGAQIIVGNTAISASNTASVDLTTSTGWDNSLVIAARGMGGNLNTANVLSVNAVAPLIQVSAQENGSNWDGHVVAYAEDIAAGTNTYAFTGGSITGSNVIAAEFRQMPEPSSAALLGLGFVGLLLRRRK